MQQEQPFSVIEPDNKSIHPGLVLLCDHASNHVPADYDGLGLPASAFVRHIAYDIGAADVTRALAKHFGAPAHLAGFSRLLIDANRGADDPTLVMKLSDGAIIPGNVRADVADRLARFHAPYHQAITDRLDRLQATGIVPVIVSVHSFTPHFKDHKRPWEVAILWDKDPRLAVPLIGAVEEAGFVEGDNQPYDGALENDCLFQHGTARGFPHALIEIRQDLIDTPDKAAAVAARLAGAIAPLLNAPSLQKVQHFGSRALDGNRFAR